MRVKEEISDEFKEYADMDYKESYSLNKVYVTFNTNKNAKNFGLLNRRNHFSSDKEINTFDKAKLFAETLKEHGNLEYAMKLSKIGRNAAKYYLDLFNDAASERGLPLIFVRKKKSCVTRVKLNAKQVSYIKYLCTKYTVGKVATMYNVGHSAISKIKTGSNWRSIAPAIISATLSEKKINVVPPTEAELKRRLSFNQWGDKPICPRCAHAETYWNKTLKYFICKKCFSSFNIYTKTIYYATKVPLAVWYKVEWLLQTGISSQAEIARLVSISDTAARRMVKKIKSNQNKSLILSCFEIPLSQQKPKKSHAKINWKDKAQYNQYYRDKKKEERSRERVLCNKKARDYQKKWRIMNKSKVAKYNKAKIDKGILKRHFAIKRQELGDSYLKGLISQSIVKTSVEVKKASVLRFRIKKIIKQIG